jgi:hypothetical protein
MPFPFAIPRDVSPRLRWLQTLQLGVVAVAIVGTFFAAVIPSKHKAFTFSLLYNLIFTSITTSFIINKEQKAAAQGLLTKDKYAKYQLYKLLAAFAMGTVAWIVSIAVSGGETTTNPPKTGNGLWLNGVKVNGFHWIIIWTNVLNWVLIWASLLYSCCMTSTKPTGPNRLGDEESNIVLDSEYTDETANDEALARQLQADDPNWRE